MTDLEKAEEYVNCSNHGKQFEVIKLEKENEELKAQIELYSEKVSFWEEQSKLKDSQLEEDDRQAFFTIMEIDELKTQIEKMKNVGNCKHAMQCSEWVKHHIKADGIKCCLNCDKWELAE